MNAIYARVSTDPQKEKQTIKAQLHNCRGWAEAHSYRVGEIFKDEGVSGATPFEDRPAGKQLLDLAKAGAISRVVVYTPDRLARSVLEALLIMRTFEQLKVSIDFVTQSFDDTPEGRFQFQVMLSVAELERELIARRTKLGRARKVREGQYMASVVPFGFRRNADGGLEIDENQAEIVRQIFAWAKDGLGLHAIGTKLDQMGIVRPGGKPRKREWHSTTLWKILTNPRYVGKATYAGQPMECPAVIDEETFSAVQVALRERRGRGLGDTPARFYLLRGKVFCRACGGTCGGRTDRKPNGWKRSTYQCQQARRYKEARAKHTRTRWPADEVEAAIKAWLLRLVEDPEQALALAELRTAEAHQAQQDANLMKSKAQAELDSLENDINFIVTQARKGNISEAVMVSQLDQIKARREELETILSQPAPEIGQDIEKAAETLQLLIGWLVRGGLGPLVDEPLTSSLVNDLIQRVWLNPDGSATIEGVFEIAERTCPRS